MRTIEITDEDFARLQNLATAFVDTPATVVTRLIDHFEVSGDRVPSGDGAVRASATPVETRRPVADSPDDDASTAHFGGRDISTIKHEAGGDLTSQKDGFEEASAAPPKRRPAMAPPPDDEVTPLHYGEHNIPPLQFTTVTSASFGGQSPGTLSWNHLVRLALSATMDKVRSFSQLSRISRATLVEGKRETNGYKPVHPHDFSYCNDSTPKAVMIISRCAKELGVEAKIEFRWKEGEGVYRPGRHATLTLGSSAPNRDGANPEKPMSNPKPERDTPRPAMVYPENRSQ